MRHLVALGLGAAIVLGVATAAAETRLAASPPDLPSGGSAWMERTLSWPVEGALKFDYVVDAPAGASGLSVSVDSVEVSRLSGMGRSGTERIPVSAGSHNVRFTYLRGSGATGGLSRAFVDNIQQLMPSSAAPGEIYRFDEAVGAPPSQWTTGGGGGGWRVATESRSLVLRRHPLMANAGYQPAPSVGAIERSFVWPAVAGTRHFKLEYFVDSEAGKDVFRILVDGVEAASVSGPGRHGKLKIPISSGGAHTVRFEYRKDESVDEGRDEAQVLEFAAMADGVMLESSGGLGGEPGAAPSGWLVPPNAQFGWSIGSAPPRRTFVLPSESDPPAVDGRVTKDYPQPTRLRLPFAGSGSGRLGELWVSRRSLDGAISLGMRVGTVAASGEVVVYVDAAHEATLAGLGCPSTPDIPGTQASKFVFSYDTGQTGPPTIAQYRGTCSSSNPWISVTGSGAWAVQFAAGVPGTVDSGFVHLEAKLIPPAGSPAVAASRLGLGFQVQSGGQTAYRFPLLAALGPWDTSISSLQSVRFYSMGNDLGSDSERWLQVDGKPFTDQ